MALLKFSTNYLESTKKKVLNIKNTATEHGYLKFSNFKILNEINYFLPKHNYSSEPNINKKLSD